MSNYSLELTVVVPEEAVNLVANPSFEFDGALTGYTVINGTQSRDSTYARRGLYAGKFVSPGGSMLVRGIRSTSTFVLTAGQPYTFSFDLRGDTGVAYYGDIVNNSGGTVLARTSIVGTGRWQRKSVGYIGAGETVYLRVAMLTTLANTFYTDGWLFKTGGDNTYFDGDSRGWLRGRTEFRWNGVAHQSSSWRSGSCGAGGALLRVKDYARIHRTRGLGLGDYDLAGVELARGGEIYQGARAQARYFSLDMMFSGADELAMLKDMAAIEAAVHPKRVPYDEQPVMMIATWVDSASGEDVSEPVEIACVYVTGLQGEMQGPFSWRTVTFKMPQPLLLKQAESAQVIGWQRSFSAYALARRDRYGAWSAWGVTSITASAYVRACIVGPDGRAYIGGWWGQINGDTTMAYVAAYHEATGWERMGSGLGNTVYKLLLGPDGKVYAFGAFTNGGGDANADYEAVWDGVAWASIGGLAGANGAIRDACWTRDGKLCVVGAFTTIGGISASRAALYDPVTNTWAAMGTGMNGTCYAVVPNLAGTGVIIGGAYTTAGGSAFPYLAEWNGSAYVGVGGAPGVDGSPNGNVEMLRNYQGRIVASGPFTIIGGLTVNYVGCWNGSRWEPVGGGLNDEAYDYDNDLYSAIFAGNFTLAYSGSGAAAARPLILADRIVRWTGSQYAAFEIDLPGTSTVYNARYNPVNGDLYLTFANGGTVVAQESTPVSLTSYEQAWPRFVLYGPGKIWSIFNQTTGKGIYFDNLTIGDGEVITVYCSPNGLSVKSTWVHREDLNSYILPASSRDFMLIGGRNDILAYLYGGTSAASKIVMIWQGGYETLNGAIY